MRLDLALAQRNLAPSRTLAQRLIESGFVLVNGAKITKSSFAIEEDDEIRLLQSARFVSRGGEKLEGALQHFQIEVAGRDCLDVGASTGGFSDCLLQRGAARVFCLDAGNGQLHDKIKLDPRVTWREGFNARALKPEDLPFAPQIAVMDVSFISQTLLLPAIFEVLAPRGQLISLIKPQFELSPSQIGKGGLVRDAKLHQMAIKRVKTAAQQLGFGWRGLTESSIEGGEGNREWLCWLQKD